MKLIKSIFLTIVILSFHSCTKNETIELPDSIQVKTIDMNDVGTHYDMLVTEIQSSPDFDVSIGHFKLEMRKMKPVIDMTVENTIILDDERDTRTIVIDHNTQSIYIRYTDIEKKYNYTLYGAKDPSHIEELLQLEGNNYDLLSNSTSYKNRLNQSLSLDFVSTNTSFLIKKPMLTTKEELIHAKGGIMTHKTCAERSNHTHEEFKQDESQKGARKSTSRNWNIVIYKQSSSTNTSGILDAVKSSFRSLSSVDGSSWNYSPIMYANLNVSYHTVPSTIHNYGAQTCLNNLTNYLYDNSIPNNRTTHSHIFLASAYSAFSWGIVGLADPYSTVGAYRVAVSSNRPGTFAHELGHTLEALHFDAVVWDSSLAGGFGWFAESLMHSSYGGSAWYASYQWKYYEVLNRARIKNVLNN